MSLDFALKDIDLARLPDRPGAVILFDDVNPLYVAQTANMRAWIRRLLDTGRQDNTRAAIAKYLADTRTDLVHLRSLPGLNEQVREFLNFCRVRLHPEDSRETAIQRKASLISSLSPKLQTSTGKTTVPAHPSRPRQRSRRDDPIVKLLTKAGQLTHIDRAGRPRMVDVSAKTATARQAVAKGSVYMAPQTLALAVSGRAAKGDVLTTAQLAGIMAAKRTHELIPLCHPLPLTGIEVSLEPDEGRGAVDITAAVRTTAKTGVEMEALTAVSVAALTVYDMLKAAQRDIRIGDIRLVRKTGGKSGEIELETDAPVGDDELILQTGDRIANCHEKVARYCQGRFSSFDLHSVPHDAVLRENEVRLANTLLARMDNSLVTQFMSRSACVGAALKRIPPDSALWDKWSPGHESAMIDLFACVLGPGIDLARATKVLHKKRPNVIPILDKMVTRYAQRAAAGARVRLPSSKPERGVALIRILRADVERNRDLLTGLGEEFGLSAVRVLDILLWVWAR